MVEQIQNSNRENIAKLKDWQAEAYIFVLLFCCVNISGLFRRGWNLSKICALYELVGDVFEWEIVKKVCLRVNVTTVELYEELKTNLRLLPNECHQELFNLCSIILQKGNTKEDQEVREIISTELE